MKKLLIDIGNTTTHLKWFDTKQKKFIHEQVFLTKELISNSISFDVKYNYDQAIYCSVVKDAERIIKINLKNAINIKEFERVLQDDFVYPINLLGEDFIANFYAFEKSDGVIVSMGTATTFMIIKNYKMIGAIIAPGLESGSKGLELNAPLLDYNLEKQGKWEDRLDGLFTIDAINKGVINGHWYMIKGMLKEIKNTHKVEEIILTGGYSTFINQSEIKNDLDLIFKGILNISDCL